MTRLDAGALMTRLLAIAALAGALSACTHSRSLMLDSPSRSSVADQLSGDLRGRTATLTLANGSRVEAPDAQLADRSLTWQGPAPGDRHTVRLADLRELSVRSRARGALDGLLIGLAIGVPAGALVIDSPNGGSGSRGQAAISGGLSIGLLSAAIGAARGSRIVYRLKAPRSSGHRPAAITTGPEPDRRH